MLGNTDNWCNGDVCQKEILIECFLKKGLGKKIFLRNIFFPNSSWLDNIEKAIDWAPRPRIHIHHWYRKKCIHLYYILSPSSFFLMGEYLFRKWKTSDTFHLIVAIIWKFYIRKPLVLLLNDCNLMDMRIT